MTEKETEDKTPVYAYNYNYNNYGNNGYSMRNNDNNNQYDSVDYNTWRNQMYNNYNKNYGFNNGAGSSRNCNNCNGVPCTNWRYRESYFSDPDNYDYYPTYDDCLGHYNWRY